MKKALVLISIVIILDILFMGYQYYADSRTYKKEHIVYEEDPSWHASYIWADTSSPNTWACFRKNFVLEDNNFGLVNAKIAVDSKYFLYINGQRVVFDGGLKKQVRDAIYYDTVNITRYLQKGENNISVLVWYYGESSFSHVDTGTGALLFQAQIKDKFILSDDSWKVIINPAFLKDEEQNNKRLAEKNIIYDARKEIADWNKPEFDDSEWKNATIVGNVSDERYGELIPKDIPDFTYTSGYSYDSKFGEKYFNKTYDKDTVLKMELRENRQVFPYIEVESQEGKKILVSNIHDFNNELFYRKNNLLY